MTFAERAFTTAANVDAQLAVEIDTWRMQVRRQVLARAAASRSSLPRRFWVGAIVAALLLHVLLALWLIDLMRPQISPDRDRILVTLIDAPPVEPPLPEPPPKPQTAAPNLSVAPTDAPVMRQPIRAQPRASAPAAAATQTLPPTVELHVYNRDGSLDVPKDLVEQIDAAQPKPNFIAQSVEPSPIMLPHRPLKIRPNHFAKDWVHPVGETLLDAGINELNNLLRSASTSKEFTTPWGDKVACSWILIMGGCQWGIPPPPGGRPMEPWKPATVLDEY